MSLEERFETAQVLAKSLSKTPAPGELLELYGWYKQATVGDVSGSRPGVIDFRGRAKYDAWAERKGQTARHSMEQYAVVVERLRAKYG